MIAIREHAEFIDRMYEHFCPTPYDLDHASLFGIRADGDMGGFVNADSVPELLRLGEAEMLAAHNPFCVIVSTGLAFDGTDDNECRYTLCFDRNEVWAVVAFRSGRAVDSRAVVGGRFYEWCHGYIRRARIRWN